MHGNTMYVIVSNVTFGFGTQNSCSFLQIITLSLVCSFSYKSLRLSQTGVLFLGTGKVKLILGVRKKENSLQVCSCLCYTKQSRPKYYRCFSPSAEYRGRIISFNLLAMLFLMQPGMPLAFFVARPCC